MGWAIAIAAIVLVLLLARGNSGTHNSTNNRIKLPYTNDREFKAFMSDLVKRMADLPKVDRDDFIIEVRRLALAGYNRLFDGAIRAGKSESFAHQAGALDASFCVLANDDSMRQNAGIRELMQLNTMPFNLSPPAEGKNAIIEYLVWTISAPDADLSLVKPSVVRFVAKVLSDSEAQIEPEEFINSMITSMPFAWQTLASEYLVEEAGNV